MGCALLIKFKTSSKVKNAFMRTPSDFDRIRLLSYNRSSSACDTVVSSERFTHLLHENVSGAMFYPGEENAKSKGMLHRDPPNACKH